MQNNQDIINDLMSKIRNDVINSLQSSGRYATGETIQNLTIATADSYGALYAPWWVDALEKGRKPTSPTGPYQQSDPSFLDRIKEWVSVKAPDLNPYAVWKSINKYGYPGKPGVLTQPLEMADNHIDTACEQIADQHAQKIADLFNIFD